MRIMVTTVMMIINFILQSTVFEYIKIWEIKPNTGIAFIVAYSLLRGSVEGAIVGFFTGLLQDMFFGTSLGYYALIGLYIGFICGIPTKNFYRENFLLPLLFTCASTFLTGAYVYVTGFLFRGHLNFTYFVTSIIIPEVAYTSLVSIALYRLMYSVNERIEAYEKKRSKMF